MKNIISIDLGYSTVKGENLQGTEVMFDSLIAPYVKHPLDEGDMWITEITRDGVKTKYFWGERAKLEGENSSFTYDKDRYLHPSHDILLLTAAYQLDYQEGDILVVGVPISYRDQKDELLKKIKSINAVVSVNGEPPRTIKFNDVYILTQGITTFSLIDDLPEGTLVAIDIGEKTTDVAVVEHYDNKLTPIPSLCFSLEMGVQDKVEAVRDLFQSETGSPISYDKAKKLIKIGSVSFKGKTLDFTDKIHKVATDVANALAERIKQRLGDTLDFASKVYLLGGGIYALPIEDAFYLCEIVPSPRQANAKGYLKIIAESGVLNG